MAYGAFAETKARYRDLETLVDYRAYDGSFRERVCELAKLGDARAEFFVYG